MILKTLPLKEALDTLKLPGLESNLFSSAPWLSVLDQTYQLRLFVKYLDNEGTIVSYIIYSVVHNFLEDKICICSYCDYFDCHISDAQHWSIFFQALRSEYPKFRMAVRNLRDETARQFPQFSLLSKEWYHWLDVRDGIESLWKKTHDSFRSPVKQAQKAGVVVRPCDRGGLEKFYHLHLKLRKNKYRLFPQPYKFFENIWKEYIETDRGVLLGAFDAGGQFIGGTVFLICGDTLYYKFNTSSLVNLKLRPNNLLLWEGIKFAKNRNLNFIDLGSSGLEQHGLVMFKDHAGAKRLEITHLGFAPPGYKFSQKIILKTLTRLATHPLMPDVVLRWGSHLIYPYLA